MFRVCGFRRLLSDMTLAEVGAMTGCAAQAAELRGDDVGQSGAEIVLVGIAAQINEGRTTRRNFPALRLRHGNF